MTVRAIKAVRLCRWYIMQKMRFGIESWPNWQRLPKYLNVCGVNSTKRPSLSTKELYDGDEIVVTIPRMEDPRKDRTTIPLIYVVDDDKSVREAISNLVRSAGYRCAMFPSAEAFLDSGCVAETDCLVLDIGMAGLTGPELQLKLCEMNYWFPIIFISAGVDNELRAKLLEHGATAVLDKPFAHQDLLDAIHLALH
jgi:CheY-like chemotaxis protein